MNQHRDPYEPLLDGFPHAPAGAESRGRTELELLLSEFADRQRNGENPAVEDYARAHPGLAGNIRELFPLVAAMERLKGRKEASILKQRLSQQLEVEKIGDCRILRELGRGGMGVVFEAWHELRNRRVALKLLPWRYLNVSQFRERFHREAQMAAKLRHRNIVPVLEFGELDGFSYYVMQFIEGVGLDWLIERLRGSEGVVYAEEIARLHAIRESDVSSQSSVVSRLAEQKTEDGHSAQLTTDNEPPTTSQDRSLRPDDWHKIARIGLQVADALRYAHRAGTVHRDVKPANLLLDKDGRVWVTDFGLAETLERDSASSEYMAGTLRYMAPEEFSGRFDERSDVYALGVTLYELLTLQPAFREVDDRRLVRLIVESGPPPLRRQNPAVPRDLETIVLGAIARDPADRFQSAGELASELLRFLNRQPLRTKRPGLMSRFVGWCRCRIPGMTGKTRPRP